VGFSVEGLEELPALSVRAESVQPPAITSAHGPTRGTPFDLKESHKPDQQLKWAATLQLYKYWLGTLRGQAQES